MRIGYSFWGVLADYELDFDLKRVTSPCGNATYAWSVVYAAAERGHQVFPLQRDRDIFTVCEAGADAFSSFSPASRMAAYRHLDMNRRMVGEAFPELDVILIEWRWRIPGRNTEDDRGTSGYTPDLDRQTEILNHYKNTNTKIILWDLDYKLTVDDERMWRPDAIFETSVKPKYQWYERRRVEFPIPVGVLMQHPTSLPLAPVVYVGNRYERDGQIDEWIRPLSEKVDVHFFGNWTNEPHATVCAKKWPRIITHPRIGVEKFRSAMEYAAIVPLLSKPEYAANGFVTPRPWEALMFGALPVGLKGHLGIGSYAWRVARDANDLHELVKEAMEMTVYERHVERETLAARLSRCDATRFIDEIEKVTH
jgi:hypothetical protein